MKGEAIHVLEQLTQLNAVIQYDPFSNRYFVVANGEREPVADRTFTYLADSKFVQRVVQSFEPEYRITDKGRAELAARAPKALAGTAK